MNDIKVDRREFIKGACSAAAVGVAGPSLFFSGDAEAAVNGHDTVVLVFLRGGMDGLNLVVPISGPDRTLYETLRPKLKIPTTGEYAALPLRQVIDSPAGTLPPEIRASFGLHPAARGLHTLWDARKLAIVHGCGMRNLTNRSHFDTQFFLDAGKPGFRSTADGWLTRAWEAQQITGATGKMPLLAAVDRIPTNVRGSSQVVAMPAPASMALDRGGAAWNSAVRNTVGTLWAGTLPLQVSGQSADTAIKLISSLGYSNTRPQNWPSGRFADELWTVAQSITKSADFGLGLRYATVNLDGWDTHHNQGTVGPLSHYHRKVVELDALSAFYHYLNGQGFNRVTVIVQSEFGRRARENSSLGTDHGYGNPLLVLGDQVAGRTFYGSWAGLSDEVLDRSFGDIPVTTDYRQVFSEILMRRMGNNKLGVIFPGYTYGGNMGIVRGLTMTPDYSTTLVAAAAKAVLPDSPQPVYGESLQAVPATGAATRKPTRRGVIERLMAVFGLSG